MKTEEKITLWSLFWVMAKIGAFTIGGGYAMLLIIQKEITSRGWISEEEFPDLVALSQAAPGLLAVNISIFTGYRLKGTPGAIVATLGSCMPPFLIILAIALFFSDYANAPLVQSAFAGMRPAVVALIAVPMVKMARTSLKKWWQWLMAALVIGLVAFLKVSPVYILICVITVSMTVAVAIDRKRRAGK